MAAATAVAPASSAAVLAAQQEAHSVYYASSKCPIKDGIVQLQACWVRVLEASAVQCAESCLWLIVCSMCVLFTEKWIWVLDKGGCLVGGAHQQWWWE